VKQARSEAGLSLAQLGKGHVTAPAIYLIETGRTRPSLPTLEHIARQTGKPVEFFLAEPAGSADDAQASLLELEALVADGRYEEGIALGTSLLDKGSSAFRLGRIRYFLARAYLGSGHVEPASRLLVESRLHFEALSDGAMLAECIGVQASIAIAQQSKDARGLAEEALAVCRSLKPVPAATESRLLGILARAHAANHDLDQAIAAYQEAIDVGNAVFDLPLIARVYTMLGVAYREVGEVETAARYAMRSIALHEVLHDRASQARSENDLGLLLMARGDLASGRRHLDRALDLSEESGLEFGRSQVLLSLCELSLQEGRIDDAFSEASEAMELAERLEDGIAIAEAHVWLGRIADRRGEEQAVDYEFDQAIRGFEALGMHERLLQTHGVYAEVLERRGELAKAYVHMKEALQASRPGLLRREQEQEQERVSSA
jgi:tetratricopeptide (TPR) repeat protein